MVNSDGFVGCQVLNHVEEKETTSSMTVMSDLIVQRSILWSAISTCGIPTY